MSDRHQEHQPKIEKSFDLFNPGGDPAVLRACAESWRHMAHDLKSTIESQDQEVTRLGDDWTGAAADAFHSHWKATRAQVEKALPHFETVAHQLDTTADAIQKANEEVHRVVEEVLATVAIGIGLSVLTAGFSDALAAGAAEAEIAEATAEVTRLGQLLIRAAKTIETVKEAMADSRLLKFTIEFGKNTGANFIGNAGGQWVTGQKITWGQDFQDAAVAGAVGSAAGLGSEALGGKVGEWAASSHARGLPWEPGKAVEDVLKGKGALGGVVVGGGTSAIGQGAADGVDIVEGSGSKHASDVAPDMLTSLLTGGAAGGANHVGEKINDGGGGHRATDREGFPGWQQIPADGIIYGAGNAAEYEAEQANDE
ncbi:WXG100 family type VII secretion target [Streptomyces lydicus]|uniref:WXG100 family type VII secretion target n=1 Tax=Streptomyces lydicus TaxID=47763 RepID=UPI00379C1D8A